MGEAEESILRKQEVDVQPFGKACQRMDNYLILTLVFFHCRIIMWYPASPKIDAGHERDPSAGRSSESATIRRIT